jgi:pimeloyl-ACP methyl ester carboxylesterase
VTIGREPELIRAVPGTFAPTRVALLPGAYHGPDDFVRAGFVTSLRARQLPVDLVLVDLGFEHLSDCSVLPRLHAAVVEPARAAGCRRLWLAGISLGGFVALNYAAHYPGQLAGMCLIAPYLGNRMITGEIRHSGGVQHWQPGLLAEHDDERTVWSLIKSLPPTPVLFLGYGRSDRFASDHRLLASVLPAAAVEVIDGGHDWPVWGQLWDRFLDRRFADSGPGGRRDVDG